MNDLYTRSLKAAFDPSAFAVGYAYGSVGEAIRWLERGDPGLALQALRNTLPHLEAAIPASSPGPRLPTPAWRWW
jgi:hypothetical protein